ncbi:hypothetical protein [Hymenobacter jeollabukensis]|uniref:Dienelactone hydrolase domain-containing protein n=1 Tax=Hymenobacter jeollabukensis TaxID=2025313 RepID=A0A5R8WM00_9BACT|nr:hypothetical protein [Hymenobacter jeollabukensis]TLM90423.1 hypothetical protein FDY95_17020 [Hymenobacter jeollabukensis]
MMRRFGVRGMWTVGLGLSLLAACSPAAEQQRAAPVGRYEGSLTYRGAELPVVLNVYQDSASRVVQVQLRTPGAPVYARWFDSVAYQAPSLAGRLPGGGRLALREEPNFLTGTVWLHDTLRAELVAVRRGPAALPTYTVTRQAATNGAPAMLRYEPRDTARRRPALLYWSAAGAAGTAYGWADWLVGQGVVVAVAAPAAAPDSVAAQQLAAALQRLRADAGVDSARVGVWAVGPGGRAAALAAAQLPGPPRYMLVQGAAFSKTDRVWLRQLGRQRVAVLGLYGALDTTLSVPESSQLLRAAVRRRGSGVKVYEGANQALLLIRPEKPDSVRHWPGPPADLAPSLQEWLGNQLRR